MGKIILRSTIKGSVLLWPGEYGEPLAGNGKNGWFREGGASLFPVLAPCAEAAPGEGVGVLFEDEDGSAAEADVSARSGFVAGVVWHE